MQASELTDPRDRAHAVRDENRNRAKTYVDSHQRPWCEVRRPTSKDFFSVRIEDEGIDANDDAL